MLLCVLKCLCFCVDSGLRERLNKIMASDYFTTTPEMKAPVEVAAAAGNYVPFQVPIHSSVSSVAVEGSVSSVAVEGSVSSLAVEGSVSQFEQV